jgi:hypothetical protein
LSQPLSREETAMLRVSDWLEAATCRGDDLVIDLVRPTGVATASESASAQLMLSPSAGVLLTALPGGDQACGFAVSHSDVSLLPAGGAGRLEIRLPSPLRLTATVGLSLESQKGVDKAPATFRRSLSFNWSVGNVTEGKPAGLAIAMPVEPVACLALVHEDSPRVSFEEDTLVIEVGGTTSRFDTVSGRPLGISFAGCEVSLHATPGAVDAAVEKLRAAAGQNMVRENAPVASAVEFLLSGQGAAACSRVAEAARFSGAERSVWEGYLGQLVEAIARCREDGGLDRCDRLLAAVSADRRTGSDIGGQPQPLSIPGDDEPASASAAQKSVTRHAAAVVWRLVEEHCGRDSWPAALVRAGSCAMVSDPAVLDEMADFMTSEEHGPLAHVSASSLTTVPLVAASLARRGQERLSTVAFHTDCHPLLAAFTPYGLDVLFVSFARSLEDAAVREIGRAACGDPEILLPLVHSLKAHKTHDDAVAGLQAALDTWWDGGLRAVVAAKFDAIASPRTATAPGDHKEQPLK